MRRPVPGRRFESVDHYLLDLIECDRRRTPGTRVVGQSNESPFQKPAPPLTPLGCDTPSFAATVLLSQPSPHARTILDRSANASDDFARLDQRIN